MSPVAVALSAMRERRALRQLKADAAAVDAGAAAAVAATRAALPLEPARVRTLSPPSPASARRAPLAHSAMSEEERCLIREALREQHEPNSPPPCRPPSQHRLSEAAASDDDNAFEDALDDYHDDLFEDAQSSPPAPTLPETPPTPPRARSSTDDSIDSAEGTSSEASGPYSHSAASCSSPFAARALRFDEFVECNAPSEAPASELNEAPVPADEGDDAAPSDASVDELTLSEAPVPADEGDEAATSEAPAPADCGDEAVTSSDAAATSEAPAPADYGNDDAISEASSGKAATSEAPVPADYGDGVASSEAATRRSLLIAKATRDADEAARAAEDAHGATRQHVSDWNCSTCELPACGTRTTAVGGYQVRASSDCEQDPLNFLEVVSGLEDIEEDIVITHFDENDGVFDSLTTALGCTGDALLCTGSVTTKRKRAGGAPHVAPPPPPPVSPPSQVVPPPEPPEPGCPVS